MFKYRNVMSIMYMDVHVLTQTFLMKPLNKLIVEHNCPRAKKKHYGTPLGLTSSTRFLKAACSWVKT